MTGCGAPTSGWDPMLEVTALHVRYGTTHAVRGIDLSVSSGEAVALLGANGAGKTSTLRAISQLVPYEGSIRFDGTDISGLAVDRVARLGLVHVPEGRHVFPDLTVHENLQLGVSAANGRTDGYSLEDVYSLFPLLDPLKGRPGYALSGGEQQMVAIGRALVAAPRLLLVDEPSLGLAPIVAETVTAALREIRRRTPLLVVEQNVQLALEICQRAEVLAHGEVVLRHSGGADVDHDALLASYLGQSDMGVGPLPPQG
jgi:branched-chain amino acid transport system ATP-binding protein